MKKNEALNNLNHVLAYGYAVNKGEIENKAGSYLTDEELKAVGMAYNALKYLTDEELEHIKTLYK